MTDDALSISGLYDLRPLQRAPFIADAIRLSDADALRLSPALWPAPKRGRLYAVAGGEESEEFIRQNALIHEVWGAKVVPVCEVLPGLDHFGVVDALADPGQRLRSRRAIDRRLSRAGGPYISRCSPALSPPSVT